MGRKVGFIVGRFFGIIADMKNRACAWAVVWAAVLFGNGAVAAEAVTETSTNLVANGDFTDAASKAWGGNSYGAGPGHLEFNYRPEGGFVRLIKEKGPGGTQVGQFVHLGDAERFKLKFRYRGIGSFAWYYYRKDEKGATVGYTNDMGSRLGQYNALEKSADWAAAEYVVDVPKAVRGKDNYLQLNSQSYGGSSTGLLDLASVSLVTCAVPPTPPPPPPVKVEVMQAPKPTGYSPVEVDDPFDVTIDNGLLCRNGKPYFWVGNGCEYGASQSTAVGMWLAKLLGYPAISLDPGGEIRVAADAVTNALITTAPNLGRYSRFREATRLGFFVDFFGSQSYRYSPLKAFAEKHPDFAEAHHRFGHYLSWDYFNPIGRECKLAQRKSFYDLVADQPQGKTLVELCREPGPEPKNQRCLRDFRKWAQRKYATLEEANRVWRTDFATWDDVVPLHLRPTDVTGYMENILLRRKARKEHIEFHLDWILFVQNDITKMTAAEFADLRKAYPDFKYTIDVRGHNNEVDGYCMLDPERIDELVDVFSIHFGAHPVYYRNEPYHLGTLLDQTSFPFFSYNYFRTNTKHPIVNAEDIIVQANVPGSNAESMARNDIGALHGDWKFKLEGPGEDGLKSGWTAKDFDDSSWGTLAVPGAWDETDAYRSKSGTGWYRKRFVAHANRQDYEDGSHRFYLYGKGVAQAGTVWLNGREIGKVSGWDTKYSFDVSEALEFGGENEIVWRVEGPGYQNGLRFYCHVLANDRIGEAVPFGEKQYRLMLWPYIMRGTSGCWVWSWHKDWFRPFFPKMLKQMQTAAEVVLPDLRTRRGDVAYLFGYVSNRGLPSTIEKTHTDYLNWYNALEFSGVRPDVFGEGRFVAEIDADRYKLLVVPHTLYVKEETYAKFKEYVEAGGMAVITDDSFRKTYDHWRETDIADFAAKHADKVKVIGGKPPMEDLMKRLLPYLPRPDIQIEAARSAERPLIEHVLAGGAERKVLYLANWGGMDQTLTVTLPERFKRWRVTPIVGECERVWWSGKLKTTVPSQDVVVVLLEARTVPDEVSLDISEKRTAAIQHVIDLNADKSDWKEKALWPAFKQPHGITPVGKELYPYVLDRLESFGIGSVEKDIETWTPEMLKDYRIVVLPESNTQTFYRRKGAEAEKFRKMIRRYVEEGGSVLTLVYTYYTVNNYGLLLEGFGHSFGVAKAGVPKDTKHCGFGDPYQIVAAVDPASPFATGAMEVQLYTGMALKPLRDSQARNAVVVQSGAETCADLAPMMYLELGKGRMFFSADAMAFQPFRIEEKDNAAFLVNVLGWLLRRDVTDAMREDFRRNLFLTTEDLGKMRDDYHPVRRRSDAH